MTTNQETPVETRTDANPSVAKQSSSAEDKPQVRSLDEEKQYLERISDCCFQINPGFVENMRVPGMFFVNPALEKLVMDELEQFHAAKGHGGFLPAVKQLANVAALPGVVGRSIGLPDLHSGYGFAIGNVAAMDMDDPDAVVSPGGVGFDINCGVRLIRTNLTLDTVEPVKELLCQEMFDNIPVGVGTKSKIAINKDDLNECLRNGIQWAVEHGYAWAADVEHCEERGCMPGANPASVSDRAKKRGLPQMGTLGAGNHYAEIQVVDEIYDDEAAAQMGITQTGQICIMIHSGSRGLGHQVATDALQEMEKAMAEQDLKLNDRQLACAKINSPAGKRYLEGMACAANYAWVNRQMMTHLTRQAFSKIFKKTPEEMEMHLVYDVSHNIAKREQHLIDGKEFNLLVHRKGSTRAFPPGHPQIPKDYQKIGQPVLIGGTMGTCSYVLTGTDEGMRKTFGTTCHGAGRAQSRNQTRKHLDYLDVLNDLAKKGIAIRVASPKLVTEEAPEAYKDVVEVVDTCHKAGISLKCFKLRPIAVIKG